MTEKEIIKFEKFREYYRNNPVAFVEDMFGVKLYPWQKNVINAWNGIDKGKGYICNMSFRSGKRMLAEARLEYMKALKMDFWLVKPDCYEKYEKGILVETIERGKV